MRQVTAPAVQDDNDCKKGVTAMEFDESKHLRDSDGKFAEKSASELSSELAQELPRQDAPSSKGKHKSYAEFFGEEFKGLKGEAAIDKLLQEKRGHVKNAFERPEIGSIDLVWGDESGGLLHTIMRRDKLLTRGTGTISGLQMIKKIPVIIKKGEFNIDERGRPGFDFEGCRVAIRPTYDGQKLNWIVSAMEKL